MMAGGFIFILIAVLATSWSEALSLRDILSQQQYSFPKGVTLKDGQTFDYIVVGAGAAGATVAARLALAGRDVLLIEAGGDPDLLTKIPGASMALMGSPMDWQYKTRSNNASCLASVGRQCRFSRGKCLGGSTSINHMLYTRGNRRADFEGIPFPGWSFNDLMPYFLRYEGLQDLFQLPSSSKPYHNTTGTMRTGFFDDPQIVWHSRLIKIFRSIGFPLNYDINSKSQIGVSKMVGYVYRGQRMSTARGFLAREDVKSVLKVAKNTMCTGVIINKKRVARGVTAIQNHISLKLYARKEVILSAGTIGTPQILMLSGVGPSDHLKSTGIPVKVDLPVGKGMTDHVLPVLVLQVDKSDSFLQFAFDRLQFLVTTATQLIDLLVNSRGALTSNGLTDINIFANTYCYDFGQKRLTNESSNGSDCEVPNLQIINAYIEKYLVPLVKPIFKQTTNFNDNVIEQISEANRQYAFIVISPILLEPRSVGTVQLASRDPLVPPDIYPNYLGDVRDVENIMRSIRIVEDIVGRHTFKRHNASLLHLVLPGCPPYEVDDEEYWRCYIRHMTFAVYHAAGTAPLGTVLDERLRVHGVERLRVADLSALPRVPRTNTAAVTIAIGERIADFLLEDDLKY